MLRFRKNLPKYGLCFDWETSGSDWNGSTHIHYQGISCGLAIFDLRTFEIIDEMYEEIKFDESKYKWSEDAYKIHGLSREHLEKFGLTQEEFAIKVVEWLLQYFGPNPTIMVAGHNIEFDIRMMEQLLEQFELMFKLHHVKIDTACISLVAFGSHKSDDLFSICQVGDRDTHNALEDVRMTVEAMKTVRLLVQEAFNGLE
jgi:DNA polymerase III alpha subunit (gram-positive type)